MENCDLNKPYTAKQIAEKYKISITEAIKLLNVGAKVELEHTDNLKTATAIASHHIYKEIKDYYTELKKIEDKFGDGGRFIMSPNMSFKERAILASSLLSRQEPVTYEEAKAQIVWLKNNSSSKHKRIPKYLQKSEASKDQQEQFDENDYGKVITAEQEKYLESTKTFIRAYPDGVRAYFVDGKYIRDNINSDFGQGSQSYAHPNYVPLGEIWVEELEQAEVEPVLLHEKTEYDLMKTGMSYGEAHDIAKAKEEEYRSKHTLSGGGNIEKSIYAHTIDTMSQHRTKKHRSIRQDKIIN